MSASGNHALPGDWDSAFRQAHLALDAGDGEAARELAHAVLRKAQERQNPHAEARALACLAHCDRQVSRLRRAHDASQRAAYLFQLLGDSCGEALALTTLAHTASSLGRSEEAVEAALLSVRLGEHLPPGPHQALAQNYLGAAYFWSRSFGEAQAAFEAAASLAAACVPPVSPLQPLTNLVFLDARHLVTSRFHQGTLSSTTRMQVGLETCLRNAETWGYEGLAPGTTVTGRALVQFLQSLCNCWLGDLQQAAQDLEAGQLWASRYGTPTWLLALHEWAQAEIAWAHENWARAERHVAAMTSVAIQVEHEQLACLGQLLASQIFEAQGKHQRALDELRSVRQREERIRAESLESRARVVGWQLDARQSEQSLRNLKTTSRQLERLSREDPLTGIANRRCLEEQLAEMLRSSADSGQPLSVALVDVDRFKQVNDRFSHQTGDAVLKKLAEILAAHVREHDLPARLAGDEFVVVFLRADAQVAAQVCERICVAVRDHNWSSIAEGLHLTISVGIGQAQAGDTVASLLHRSDISMYAAKPNGARAGNVVIA